MKKEPSIYDDTRYGEDLKDFLPQFCILWEIAVIAAGSNASRRACVFCS